MDSSEEAWREVEGLRENLKELREGVEGLLKERGLGQANTSASNINVHGGGVAVWVAASACVVTLLATIIASVFVAALFVMFNNQMLEMKSDYNDQTRELREQDVILQAYINAAYSQPKKEEQK